MVPDDEIQTLPDDNTSGFYHDPPLWLVEHPIDHAEKGGTFEVEFDRLDQEVLRRHVGAGVKLRANVEGIFAFDFSDASDLAISGNDHSAGGKMHRIHDIKVRRTQVMNAYLAFFYTQRVTIDKATQECMVVTPEIIIGLRSFENTGEASFGNQRVSHLAMSRYPITYGKLGPSGSDPRIQNRGLPVSSDCIEYAAQDLFALVETYGEAGVLLVDLYLRAAKAFQDHNFSLSLITHWTVIERLINELWAKLQADHASKDGKVFIDGKRRERLNDGRSFTASVMSEFLSFLGYLPKDVYDDMTAVRRVRNNWMHSMKAVSLEEAETARSVCERLLKREKNVTLLSVTPLRF
jgi:hypothetical protein